MIWCDVTCRWNSQAIFVFSGPESWFPPMFSFSIPVSCHSLLQLVWNSIFSWCHHSERVFMFYPAWVEMGQAALCLLLLSVSSQNSANTSYRDLTLRAVNCGAGFECVVPLLFSQQIQALWQQPSSSATPVTNSPTMCTLKMKPKKGENACTRHLLVFSSVLFLAFSRRVGVLLTCSHISNMDFLANLRFKFLCGAHYPSASFHDLLKINRPLWTKATS